MERGVLYSSGMIAGEGLVGILLAVFAIVKIKGETLAARINLDGMLGNWGGVAFFVLLLASMVYFIKHKPGRSAS